MTETSKKFKYADIFVTLIQDEGGNDLESSLIFTQEYEGLPF